MGIILIESSSKKIEFGYAENSKLIFQKELDSNDNADTLTYYIKKAFEENKISFENIDVVSLSNGPGSFTGLRIGSAIAKGICFAMGSKLIEIPTLDIIAMKGASELKYSNVKKNKIVSLIFSNSRTQEFYFCEYGFNDLKLERISDYSIDILENIISGDSIYITNESLSGRVDKKFSEKIREVSELSNIPAQLALTEEYLLEKKFSDHNITEPFYMKDFVPKT
jgi:tRNA threonylcarbamoyladenosine biosynthesis protein TsaB